MLSLKKIFWTKTPVAISLPGKSCKHFTSARRWSGAHIPHQPRDPHHTPTRPDITAQLPRAAHLLSISGITVFKETKKCSLMAGEAEQTMYGVHTSVGRCSCHHSWALKCQFRCCGHHPDRSRVERAWMPAAVSGLKTTPCVLSLLPWPLPISETNAISSLPLCSTKESLVSPRRTVSCKTTKRRATTGRRR